MVESLLKKYKSLLKTRPLLPVTDMRRHSSDIRRIVKQKYKKNHNLDFLKQSFFFANNHSSVDSSL